MRDNLEWASEVYIRLDQPNSDQFESQNSVVDQPKLNQTKSQKQRELKHNSPEVTICDSVTDVVMDSECYLKSPDNTEQHQNVIFRKLGRLATVGTDVKVVEVADKSGNQTELTVTLSPESCDYFEGSIVDIPEESEKIVFCGDTAKGEQSLPSNELGSVAQHVTCNDDSGIHMSEARHSSKKNRISRSNKHKRRMRLLAYHQHLVEDRGLPPSRLQQETLSTPVKYQNNGLSSRPQRLLERFDSEETTAGSVDMFVGVSEGINVSEGESKMISETPGRRTCLSSTTTQ